MIEKKTWMTWATSLLILGVIAGCGSSPQNQPFGGDKNTNPADVMTGASGHVQSVYKQNCLSCHGGSLEGKIGPKTNLQQIGGRFNKEQIVTQITNGGNGMPAFGTKLKAEETQALADWLASKK